MKILPTFTNNTSASSARMRTKTQYPWYNSLSFKKIDFDAAD